MSALTVSRRQNEAIVITLPDGRVIEVKNIGHESPYTRLRIEAPRDILIDRKEVLLQKLANTAMEQRATEAV